MYDYILFNFCFTLSLWLDMLVGFPSFRQTHATNTWRVMTVVLIKNALRSLIGFPKTSLISHRQTGKATRWLGEGGRNFLFLFWTITNVSSVCIWFGNYVTGHVTIEPAKSKSNTHGHLTSTRTQTAKSVCSHIHLKHISNEQIKMSNDGENVIRSSRVEYQATTRWSSTKEWEFFTVIRLIINPGIDYQNPFQLRWLTFSSSWTIGLGLYLSTLWLIQMKIANKHMEGKIY